MLKPRVGKWSDIPEIPQIFTESQGSAERPTEGGTADVSQWEKLQSMTTFCDRHQTATWRQTWIIQKISLIIHKKTGCFLSDPIWFMAERWINLCKEALASQCQGSIVSSDTFTAEPVNYDFGLPDKHKITLGHILQTYLEVRQV